jgi:hypothetical protein
LAWFLKLGMSASLVSTPKRDIQEATPLSPFAADFVAPQCQFNADLEDAGKSPVGNLALHAHGRILCQ